MKKLLILSIAFLSLVSCSDDDKNIIDPIIGEWQHKSELIGDSDIIIDCMKKSIFIFSTNGEWESNNYDSSCHQGFDGGIWENKGNNSYYLAGTTSDGSIASEGIRSIIFSQNNTLMSSTYDKNIEGTIYKVTSIHQRK